MTRRTALLATALVAATTLGLALGPTHAQGWGPGMGPGMGQGMGGGMGGGNPDAPWRQRFSTLDENADGVIDRNEFLTQAEGVFAAMDADTDGQLTLEEYKAVRMGPQRGLNPAREAMMQQRKVERFAPMDTNRDGRVGRDEFLAAHGGQMFKAMDGDGDGRITPQEFRRHGW
mgnify:CR=1 FL=1